MAETLNNIGVESNSWVDVNTLAGIEVGAEFQIDNTGNSAIKVIESNTQPTLSDNRGILLTTVNKNYASLVVTSGSLRIWARSISAVKGLLTLQLR